MVAHLIIENNGSNPFISSIMSSKYYMGGFGRDVGVVKNTGHLFFSFSKNSSVGKLRKTK